MNPNAGFATKLLSILQVGTLFGIEKGFPPVLDDDLVKKMFDNSSRHPWPGALPRLGLRTGDEPEGQQRRTWKAPKGSRNSKGRTGTSQNIDLCVFVVLHVFFFAKKNIVLAGPTNFLGFSA